MISRKNILVVEDEFIIADVLTNIFKTAGYNICGVADNVTEALDMIEHSRPDFVLVDIFLKGKTTGIDLAHRLMEMNIPFIYISANANEKVLEAAKVTRPYGFVVKPFREKDVLIALDIAIYRHENQRENGARQNAMLQKKASEILASSKKWEHKVLEVGKSLQPFIPFEFLSVGMQQQEDEDFYELSFFRIAYDEYQLLDAPELMVVTKQKKHELTRLKTADKYSQLAEYYNEQEMSELLSGSSFKKLLVDTYGLKSHLSVPVHLPDSRICYFNFYSRRSTAYQDDHLVLSDRVQPLLANFMAAMINAPNSPMVQKESNYAVKHPVSKSDQPNPFAGIIGGSHLLLTVFDHVMQVSGADSSVLILGESGTGKEKIAERIHALSRRKEKPFVKINCAALPATLIDSELFGHEKGAFTGAYDKKIGKFEQAHGGTLFLDEIGELPLESQSKLLRVLQEREIERIGGRTTIKTDVRIIAATNRNLEKEVADGRFRLDLFYRINVFPIVMPPLRERTEDIPDLAKYFLNIYARKTGKVVRGIAPQVLDSMKNYHWPGNIRELENLIERNVLLTRDDMINSMALPTQLEQNVNAVVTEQKIITMSEGERAHIIAALRKCNGKIWGEGGAASLLNLPPTTLNSKMKKLGIRKDFGI
ncbi:sigma 54-interacting transcriptional regulator [Mucilaginibacter auburnensis]|uniref:Transcriptional regulator with GAF, ATPase, and Fis domain n=1 Tax=Mucilaginibacter auburnensis TaxID=1457233 RepID=A0A2H9VW64_9SPHI|nr:sigma 54-interacting transcriptional regulator [Mucilaginibacter auburnensis]PJJ85029.1 transcriptional regulator with GAF, ATPase, and Fis domain [Mucilaginibacter auburnensis]